MRLLIYGFGPYKQFKENITAKILRKLQARDRVKKVIFPVRFQKQQFIEALKKYKPDVISTYLILDYLTCHRLRRARRVPERNSPPVRANAPRQSYL